jgi:hypothetical protein
MAKPSAASVAFCLGPLICLLTSLTALAQPFTTRFEAPRVVAFGDVHGAYDALETLLVEVGIIDADDLSWRGGTTHLVSLGDLVDRGPDSRKAMDLIRRLQSEAQEAGGRVHLVLGNHEIMNLTGDLRYVSAAEYAAFAAEDPDPAAAPDAPAGWAGLKAAFAPDGTYGRWLLDQPAVVIVNDTAFVHAGLSPVAGRYSPEELNDTVRALLREVLTLRSDLEAAEVLPKYSEINEAAESLRPRLNVSADNPLPEGAQAAAARFVELVDHPLLASDGPYWYRGNVWCHPLIETSHLDEVLSAWQVSRVVVGHTPTPDGRVRSRLDGRVLQADTGMLTEYYRGRASAVLFDERGTRVFYAGEPGSTRLQEDDGALLHPLPEAAVLNALATGSITPRPDLESRNGQAVEIRDDATGSELQAWFRPLRRAEVDAELAAFGLDRLLGLNIAAPVARRTLNGSEGTVTALWRGAITEAERVEANAGRQNACAAGYDALLLVYAFDGLIQNEGRTLDTIHHDRRTWRLASSGHQQSFGRSRTLPAYLSATPRRLPTGLAEAFERLDAASLGERLGDVLNDRQRQALLARRDLMLKTWTRGD